MIALDAELCFCSNVCCCVVCYLSVYVFHCHCVYVCMYVCCSSFVRAALDVELRVYIYI